MMLYTEHIATVLGIGQGAILFLFWFGWVLHISDLNASGLEHLYCSVLMRLESHSLVNVQSVFFIGVLIHENTIRHK
jgi:hypothetical protein